MRTLKKIHRSKKIKKNRTASSRVKTHPPTTSSSSSNKKEKDVKNNIVRVFMEMLNVIKLYHWKTLSYPQHKATDELYGNMQTNVDAFVEILMGKDAKRLQMVNKKIETTLHVTIHSDTPHSFEEYKRELLSYRKFLVDLNIYFDKEDDNDLLNIRDEILADLNQHMYLLAFK